MRALLMLGTVGFPLIALVFVLGMANQGDTDPLFLGVAGICVVGFVVCGYLLSKSAEAKRNKHVELLDEINEKLSRLSDYEN